jgi:DHA2 family methylenomycin A resistance protein-like MFS transporter
MLFLYSVYSEQVLHNSPFDTGLAFAPMTISMAVLAVLAGRLVAAVGVRLLVVTGLVIAAAGSVTLIAAGPMVTTAGLAFRFAILGVGFGLVSAPLTVTAVSSLSPQLTGIASSVYNAMRQVGAVVGVAVLGAIAAVGGTGSTHRVHQAAALGATLLAASALAIAVLTRSPQRPAGAGQQSQDRATLDYGQEHSQ